MRREGVNWGSMEDIGKKWENANLSRAAKNRENLGTSLNDKPWFGSVNIGVDLSKEKVKFFNLGKARKKKLKEKNLASLEGEEILKLFEVNYNQEVKEIIKTNPNSKVVLVNYPHNEPQFSSLTTELAQAGKKINHIILLNIANFELILSLKNDYLVCPLCEKIYQKEKVLKENENFVCPQDNEYQFSLADIKKFSEYVIEYHLKNTELMIKKFLSENKLTTSSIIQLTVQKKEEIFNGETQRNLLKVIESTLHEAREEARRAREKLKSDEPIPFGILTTKLSISYYDDYNCTRYNPDDYFKPLDIAMICRERGMVHTCIYLGSGKICHALSGNQVRIGDWNSFFILTGANKMLCYHPVIAFKKTDEIIKHIANCVEGKKEYYRRKGDFNIFLNNCEHFVNRCVLGLDYSELDERRSESGSRKMELNIERELKKTKEALDKVDNDVS
ncbi:6538_t:CDS:2 [Funneliformis geosporum]|nr:6538_t:CDS:2 [Funneliformis geosporum]